MGLQHSQYEKNAGVPLAAPPSAAGANIPVRNALHVSQRLRRSGVRPLPVRKIITSASVGQRAKLINCLRFRTNINAANPAVHTTAASQNGSFAPEKTGTSANDSPAIGAKKHSAAIPAQKAETAINARSHDGRLALSRQTTPAASAAKAHGSGPKRSSGKTAGSAANAQESVSSAKNGAPAAMNGPASAVSQESVGCFSPGSARFPQGSSITRTERTSAASAAQDRNVMPASRRKQPR